MSGFRGYIRGADGLLIPPGMVMKQRTADFMDGTTPSWITNTGTVSYAAPSGSRGYIKVATTAVSGNTAQIMTNIGHASNNFEAIMIELQGLSFDASDAPMDVAIVCNGAGSAGGYALQSNGDATFNLYSGGVTAGNSTDTNYNIATTGEGILDHNVGLMVFPQTKEIVMLESGEVVAYRDCSSTWINGTLTAGIQLITREAASHEIHLQQLVFTTWAN